MFFKAMPWATPSFSKSTPQYRLDPFFPLEIEREHLVNQMLETIKRANPKDISQAATVFIQGRTWPWCQWCHQGGQVSAQSSSCIVLHWSLVICWSWSKPTKQPCCRKSVFPTSQRRSIWRWDVWTMVEEIWRVMKSIGVILRILGTKWIWNDWHAVWPGSVQFHFARCTRFPLGECETPEVSFSSLHFAGHSSIQFYFLAVSFRCGAPIFNA